MGHPAAAADARGSGFPTAYRPQPESPEAGLQLGRYLAALRRYKWLVVAGAVLGGVFGAFAWRIVKPEYVAQGTIWIEGGLGAGDRGPIQGGQLLDASGWVNLMRSYVVLDHAVTTLKLYLRHAPADSALFAGFALGERIRPGRYRLTGRPDGKLALETAEGFAIMSAAPGDSLGSQDVGFSWNPHGPLTAGRRVDFTVSPPRDAARELLERLRVRSDVKGNFLNVELSGTDPALVARTVNAVADRFIDLAAELKREKLTELARILGEQLRRAEFNLKTSESELQTFQVRTVTLPSDRATPLAAGLALTRDPVFSSFFLMQTDLDQVRRDRDAIQRAIAAVPDSGLSTDALEVVGSVQASSALKVALAEHTEKLADLRALRYGYTDDHPQVQRLVQEIDTLERRTIPVIATTLVEELTIRERDLLRRIGSASRELEQIPPRAIEEARLARSVEIADNLYTVLQKRYEEARLAEASAIPDVRVLDRAVIPERPIQSRRMQFLLLGLLGGVGLGVVAALVLDRLDGRLQYPEQVTADLGLPILGVIPHLKNASNGTAAAEASPVIEALRGVRLNLVHSHGAAGPLLVTITSPGSGDGKSFVAANLALSFAAGGHRVLLIDGDSRRGVLHRVLNARRKPGLTDFLGGRTSRAELVTETSFHSLHFIGSGSRTKNAPELLSSPGMSQLMTSLRSSYNVIIVDSPPLGAGVDAYALATWTGNLLMVLRTGATDRGFAEAKLQVLDRLPVRVVGAVLNGVREWGAYRYYSYYLPGYESEDEPEGNKKLVGG